MTGPVAPSGDWQLSWAELTGYVQQAREEGESIDPNELLRYMAELRARALAPVVFWMHLGDSEWGTAT